MPHLILVVDDEEPVQQVIRDHLESCGFAVTCAGDGEEAIERLSERPHLAIIDFLLPRKNGFALAEAIRHHGVLSAMPIIMMSGVFKNPKTAVEARDKYQVVDFLAKPIDLDRLESLIHSALEGQSSAGELDLDLPLDDDDLNLSLDDPLSGAVYSPTGYDDDESSMEIEPIAAASMAPAAFNPASDSSGLELDDRSRSAPQAPSTARRSADSSQRPSISAGASRPPAKAAGVVHRGRPFPEIVSEGSVDEYPVALLLATVRYDGLTGMLDTTCEGTHRRVYIREGQPIFMQSNAEGENVGALLLRRGRITEPDFRRCMDYMKSNKRTMQRSLLELRLATEQELATAYKLLAGQLLPAAIGMPNGTFKWRETDAFVGRVPEGRFEPVSIVFDGIKRHVHPPQILKFFLGREDVPLHKTVEFDKLLPFFRRAFSANNIAAQIDGHATYREICRSRPRDHATVIPQLFALVTSGMTTLPEVTEENAMDVAVNQAAAEVAGLADGGLRFDDDSLQLQFEDQSGGGRVVGGDDDASFSAQENEARGRVRAAYARYMGMTFFEILDQRPGKTIDELQVRDEYFKLAKRWHTDAYAGLRLGDVEALLHELFHRITEAYETLNDAGKRQEYLVFLDRKAKGLPTDVNQVMQAEAIFDEALMSIRKKEWKNAREQLDQAIELNAGEAIFHAHVGWVIFKQGGKSQAALTEAVNVIKRAVAMQENLPCAYHFLGNICSANDQMSQAKKWFEKCLEFDPNNIEAARAIRLINTRAQRDRDKKGAGLLSRFLSKK